ncbi:unnamed protein product [Absidia cylindrospora]
MQEVLDFYLDVQHHEQLWRRYVRSMHKSGRLTEDDLVEGFHSPRVLSRLSHLSSIEKSPSPTMMNQQQQQQDEDDSIMPPQTIDSKIPSRQM